MPMSQDYADLKQELAGILKGRVVYLAIGNILRGDDAIGPELAARLSRMGLRVVDAGTVPENYIGAVQRLNPDTVIIIDAVHLGREPGTIELLKKHDLQTTGFTTHTMSPVLFIERLEETTGAGVYLLAIQPSTIEFGAPLSEYMEPLLTEVPSLMVECMAHRISQDESSTMQNLGES